MVGLGTVNNVPRARAEYATECRMILSSGEIRRLPTKSFRSSGQTTRPTGPTLGPWRGCSMFLQRQTRLLHRCGKLCVRPLPPTPLRKSRRIQSNGPITVVPRSSTTSTLIIWLYFGYVFCILNIMFYYILYLLNFPNSGIVKILHKF